MIYTEATVILIELGDPGGATLDLLFMKEGIAKTAVANRGIDRGEWRCSIALRGYQGFGL